MAPTKLKIGDYEAWVEIENQNIEHYSIDVNEETKVVTGWIASAAGKRFGIRVAKSHVRFDCMADIQLDASKIHGVFLPMFSSTPVLRDVAFVGEDSVRPLIFGVLNPTDDESLLTNRSYEQLGTIKVVIHRITNCKYQYLSPASMEVPKNVKINERAKKSFTHQVSFGEATTPAQKYGTIAYTLHEVVATFIFHYRSLDMLKAQDIVPPSVETGSSGSGSISRKRKAKVSGEEKPAIVEISDSEDETKEVKLEVSREAELKRIRNTHRQAKRVKCEISEVIDLTI